MKTGKIIKIENQILQNLRKALRAVLLMTVKEKFHKTVDFGELQTSVRNFQGVDRIHKKIESLYRLIYNNVCLCNFCRESNRDAVFVKESFKQCVYPPRVDDGSYFWLCPQCYNGLVDLMESYTEEGIVWFQDYDMEVNIKELGAKNLKQVEEIDREGNLDKFLNDEYFQASKEKRQAYINSQKLLKMEIEKNIKLLREKRKKKPTD